MVLAAVRRVASPAPRGQGVVEFAIVLPLLVLLMVMALDFGRVFFGWVGLHNAARIAANEAALHPEAWSGGGDPGLQSSYRETVVHDLEALNCQRPADGQPWTASDVPAPTFENKPATSATTSPYEVGDHAAVTISCALDVLTPLAGAFVGDPLLIRATAEFPVRGGRIDGVPVATAPPPPGCIDQIVPDLRGLTVQNARTAWANAGFTGTFTPTTGSDTEVVQSNPPPTTTPPSSPGDCMPASTSVAVTHSPPAPCSGSDVEVPRLRGLTVSQARSVWSGAGFTGSFTPANGSDADQVTAQTTSPSSSPGDCRAPETTVTVTHTPPPPPQCRMPQLVGVKVNPAAAAFAGVGFTGAYNITRPPSGNYTITSQSLIGGQLYDCASSVTVAGN